MCLQLVTLHGMFLFLFSLSPSLYAFLSPTCARLHTRTLASPTQPGAHTETCSLMRCTGAPASVRGCLWSLPLRWMFAQRTPASAGDSASPRGTTPAPLHLLTFASRGGFCIWHLFQHSFFPSRVKNIAEEWDGVGLPTWVLMARLSVTGVESALRQGAWAQTLKAFYNRVKYFNMKAGESPVAWEARRGPRLSRYWEGKATRRTSWSVQRTVLRRTEGTDRWDIMGKEVEGCLVFKH